MRLKPEESRKLAAHLSHLILNDQTVTLKTQRNRIQETIEKVLLHHFEEELALEREAERLYLEQASSMGAMDKGKALQMIRKQLAMDRDFVLSGAQGARFSDDKILHLAHLVGDRLYDDDLLDFKDEDEGPKFIKKVFSQYFQRENEISDRVRKKIASLSNPPFEGSRDWDVLYRKYYEEELKRLGHT
jgi:hypothetical protein